MNTVLEYINLMGKEFVGFAGPMLVQSSVLIIILLLADLVLRKKVRAVLRYWVWMLVLAKLVLPIWLSSPVSVGYLVGNKLQDMKINVPSVVINPVNKRQDVAIAPVKVSNKEPAAPETKEIKPVAAGREAAATPVLWQGVVFVIWAAVAVVMVLLLLQRVVFVCGLVAQAKEASPLMNDTLKYCCGQMGIKGTIGLKVSANATSPAVCGLYRPVILVPENLGASLGAEHLRTVLLHELAHIKRGDLWVNLVQTLLQIIYFYNPLLWLANAMIRRVREQAVDETVLVAMGERAQQYPETLLSVAKLAFKRPMLSLRLIGVVESKSALAGRIKHILGRPIPKSAKLGIWGLAAVLVFGAVLLPMAKGEERQRILKGIDEKLNISDKAGELIIESLYMEPPGGKKVIGNNVVLWVEATNKSPKAIFLGLEFYTDAGTVAVFFSPGATHKTQIYKIDANWRGRVEYPVGYARFVKGGYIKITLAKCNSNRPKESKSQLFLPDDAEILYEKKYPVDSSENAKSDNTTTRDSVYAATLPNDVTVELVGVCDYLAEGKRCWRPDGLPLEKEMYVKRDHNEANYGFVVKATGPEDLSFSWAGFEGSRGHWGSCEVLDAKGNKFEGFQAATSIMEDRQAVTSVRIGIATGQWNTIAAHDGKGITIKNGVAFSQPYETNGCVVIVASDHSDKASAEKERIIAIDTSGNIHTKDSGSVWNEKIRQTTGKFCDLKLSQVKEFQFQTRSYEWVEFKNVSLKPGTKTDVQIGAAEQVSPSTSLRTGSGTGGEIIKEAEFGKANKPVSQTHKVRKAPVVIKTVPSAFADDVSADVDKITVTFDQPMMDRSWSWTGGGETYPKTTGKIYYDSSRKTCTLPVRLEAGKVYWVGINSPSYKKFQTMGHIPAKRYVILFSTKGADGKPAPIPEDVLAEAKAINEQAEDSQKPAGQVGAVIEEAAVDKKEADEKKKTEGTSEDSGKPRVVSVRPASGSQMALISELHIVFDQPMVADKFRIVDPVLKDRPYMSMLSKCGVLYSQVVYDANNYEFIMPLTLPPNWNGSVEFNGFTTVKGAESEPVRLDYSTIREPFSADLLKRFEKARESEELKMLIQNVKTKRSSLKSLSEVVHTSYDCPMQELADKRQVDLEHNKEMSNTATFKIQGDRQFYTDISEEMKGPFYIGSDGKKCWFYNSFKKEGKLVMAEFDEIDVKKISICNPFCISETDAATAIKKNNLEYIGVGVRDGRRCYSVRSWSADLNMDRATCIAKLWWIDAETYMVSEIISDLGHSILSRRFVYEGVNQTIPDSEFRPDFVKGIAPKQPEPLGEGYNVRFINVRDGSCGRMNVRWGKQGAKGTSDSGLSGL